MCTPPAADGTPPTSRHIVSIVFIRQSQCFYRDTPRPFAAAHCRHVTTDRPDLACCFACSITSSPRANSLAAAHNVMGINSSISPPNWPEFGRGM